MALVMTFLGVLWVGMIFLVLAVWHVVHQHNELVEDYVRTRTAVRVLSERALKGEAS